MRGDFHTHSTLDDGKSSLEEMAAAARAAGLTHFGFSGHSYCPLEEDYCIHREKIPEYLARARALQVQYAGEMEVFVGLELDLLGERPEGLDYAIGSVHSICGGDGRYFAVDESPETARKCVEELFGGDWYRYTDAYYDQVALLPERTGCDWIGLFDLVTKFNERAPAFDEESPRYLRRALEVMEHLVRSGTAFEVNTGAMARGYRTAPYPEKKLLRALREFGGEIILNSDSHHTSHLCHGFPEAVELVRAAGFTHVNLWTRDGLRPVGLNEEGSVV